MTHDIVLDVIFLGDMIRDDGRKLHDGQMLGNALRFQGPNELCRRAGVRATSTFCPWRTRARIHRDGRVGEWEKRAPENLFPPLNEGVERGRYHHSRL